MPRLFSVKVNENEWHSVLFSSLLMLKSVAFFVCVLRVFFCRQTENRFSLMVFCSNQCSNFVHSSLLLPRIYFYCKSKIARNDSLNTRKYDGSAFAAKETMSFTGILQVSEHTCGYTWPLSVLYEWVSPSQLNNWAFTHFSFHSSWAWNKALACSLHASIYISDTCTFEYRLLFLFTL